MSVDALPVAWGPREPPLAPVAVVARGTIATALGTALLLDPRPALAGVCGPGLLVLFGPADALPWVDGCAYLGRDPDAPGVLLPTTLRPDAPLPLFARAVLARVPDGGAPVAVLRDPPALVPLGGARPVDRMRLTGWLDMERARR